MVTPSYEWRLALHAMDLDASGHDSTVSSFDVFNMVDDGGLVGDGSTDNAALIEAAWDTGTASGTRSRAFYWPPGDYRITRALQDTGAWNAQVRLPSVPTSDDQITIVNFGPVPSPLEWIGPTGPDPAGYAIIRSTLTGASGTASAISGGNNGSGLANINNIRPVFRDLIFMGPDNATFTMLNLAQCQGADLYWTQFANPGGYSGSPVQPTHSNAYGVKMPAREMSDVSHTVGLSIGGWYTCIRLGELDQHHGMVLGNTIVAMEAPAVYFPTIIETVTITGFEYGIKSTGFHPISIEAYIAEHSTSPSWRVTVKDVDDGSNDLLGDVKWWGVATGGTPDHSFTKTGGTSLLDHEFGVSSGPSFATPAIVLGTAAAAGAASTVIRSDSTIVAFDATVPVTQAFGDAAATGSAAVAARRDHKHGMPSSSGTGIGPILISDTPSTPLIFADLIQNEAQDDLVYADP